jgi:hypothetical protein
MLPPAAISALLFVLLFGSRALAPILPAEVSPTSLPLHKPQRGRHASFARLTLLPDSREHGCAFAGHAVRATSPGPECEPRSHHATQRIAHGIEVLALAPLGAAARSLVRLDG